MLPDITKIKGVHPGAVLSRELKKRGLESKQFALALGEYPQTINAISKGRRGINPLLSIKLGNALGIYAEYFMLLQTYYEVEKAQKELLMKEQAKPDRVIFNKLLFWDTDITKIEWQRQKNAVIRRVFERGTEAEIKEIISFYGAKTVEDSLRKTPRYLHSLVQNAGKYLQISLN